MTSETNKSIHRNGKLNDWITQYIYALFLVGPTLRNCISGRVISKFRYSTGLCFNNSVREFTCKIIHSNRILEIHNSYFNFHRSAITLPVMWTIMLPDTRGNCAFWPLNKPIDVSTCECVICFPVIPSKEVRIVRRTQRYIVKNVETSSCKVQIIPVGF
jgi:hypothetical protein